MKIGRGSRRSIGLSQPTKLRFPAVDVVGGKDVAKGLGPHQAGGAGDVQFATGRDVETIICNLDPGVTEIQLAPAVDRPELHAITDDWSRRVSDFEALTDDAELRMAIDIDPQSFY